jgi:type I restriction enzyme S subunit
VTRLISQSLPENWIWAQLGDVCEINPLLPSDEIPSPDTKVTFLPMAAVDNLDGRITFPVERQYREVSTGFTSFHNGDVLFAKITPSMENGKAAIAKNLTNGLGFGSTEFHVLRPSSVVSAEWVLSFVRQEDFRRIAKRNFTGTAGQQRVPTEFLERFQIPLPPLPEQKRITAILNHAAELRRRRREADELTQKLLPTLFYEMFGDPQTNTKGWDVTTIGQLTSLVTSGQTPRGGSTVYTTEGPYFIRSQNVLMNRLDLSDVACLSPQVHEDMKRTQIEAGDVLLNITGASIGRVAWVEKLNHEANVSQHVCIIRLEPSKAMPHYVSVYLSLPHSQKSIMLAQSGASRQGLNHQQVRRLSIHLPPHRLQIEFSKRVQLIMALGNEANNSQLELGSLFSSLLARAFTGELTEGWREQHQSELRDAVERRDQWFKNQSIRRLIPTTVA